MRCGIPPRRICSRRLDGNIVLSLRRRVRRKSPPKIETILRFRHVRIPRGVNLVNTATTGVLVDTEAGHFEGFLLSLHSFVILAQTSHEGRSLLTLLLRRFSSNVTQYSLFSWED